MRPLRTDRASAVLAVVFLGAFLFSTASAAWAGQVNFASKATKSGLFAEEMISLEALRELQSKDKTLLILDARGQASYRQGHIQGAKLALTAKYYEQEELFRQGILKEAPNRDKALLQATSKLPKDQKIVTYCNNECHASAVLVLQLKRLGFKDVRAMEDGFQTWQQRGYPWNGEEKGSASVVKVRAPGP